MEFSQKQLSIAFVIIFIAFLWTLLKFQGSVDKIEKLKSQTVNLNKKIDSLEQEIFVLELKLFRQEEAIKIFEQENPTAASQLGDIISDETE